MYFQSLHSMPVQCFDSLYIENIEEEKEKTNPSYQEYLLIEYQCCIAVFPP